MPLFLRLGSRQLLERAWNHNFDKDGDLQRETGKGDVDDIGRNYPYSDFENFRLDLCGDLFLLPNIEVQVDFVDNFDKTLPFDCFATAGDNFLETLVVADNILEILFVPE